MMVRVGLGVKEVVWMDWEDEDEKKGELGCWEVEKKEEVRTQTCIEAGKDRWLSCFLYLARRVLSR